LKTLEHTVLAWGAAMALLAGVATAKIGLAPLHDALAAEAPSLDTAVPDAGTEPALQADPATAPPAVVVPASTEFRPTRNPSGAERGIREAALDTDEIVDSGVGGRLRSDDDGAAPRNAPREQGQKADRDDEVQDAASTDGRDTPALEVTARDEDSTNVTPN
jgi:hypothetical protein